MRTGNSVEMNVDAGVPVTHDGNKVSSIALTSNDPRRPTVARLGSFQWFVIERADRIGIRLRDTAAPAIAAFDGRKAPLVDDDCQRAAVLLGLRLPRLWILGAVQADLVGAGLQQGKQLVQI